MARVQAPEAETSLDEGRDRADPARPGQYLAFLIGGDQYGMGVLRIREILEHSQMTPVPLTPPWIRGVLNLRGSVMPVVDLAIKFGLPETEVTKKTCVIIVEVEAEDEMSVMGILVDSVNRVVDLLEEEIEPPPSFGTQVRVDYLQGMGRVDDDLVLLLDVDRVLSADELLTALDVEALTESAGEDDPDDGEPKVEEPGDGEVLPESDG